MKRREDLTREMDIRTTPISAFDTERYSGQAGVKIATNGTPRKEQFPEKQGSIAERGPGHDAGRPRKARSKGKLTINKGSTMTPISSPRGTEKVKAGERNAPPLQATRSLTKVIRLMHSVAPGEKKGGGSEMEMEKGSAWEVFSKKRGGEA